MREKFAGPMIGGPQAGRWMEGDGPVVCVLHSAGRPLASALGAATPGEVDIRTHQYVYQRWPTPDGPPLGCFRHQSLDSHADVMRELLINYRPLASGQA